MRITAFTGVILFVWDVVPSFENIISVVASHKKPDFYTPKMKNAFFIGQTGKRPPWCSSLSQGPRMCLI
jgi:hypothetical protein